MSMSNSVREILRCAQDDKKGRGCPRGRCGEERCGPVMLSAVKHVWASPGEILRFAQDDK